MEQTIKQAVIAVHQAQSKIAEANRLCSAYSNCFENPYADTMSAALDYIDQTRRDLAAAIRRYLESGGTVHRANQQIATTGYTLVADSPQTLRLVAKNITWEEIEL